MNGQVVGGFGNTLTKLDYKLDLGHRVRMSGEKSPPLSSTLENVEDFMVSTTTSKTTIAIEGVGIVDNPMCYATKLAAMKRKETSKDLGRK
jgi:hypothetical protein